MTIQRNKSVVLALNTTDLFLCMVTLPLKIVTFITQPALVAKPLSILYFDAVYFWSSSLTILFIAINNYIKVSRPSKYDQMLSKKRMMVLISTIQVFSFLNPGLLFVNLHISAVANITMFLLVLITLPLFYVLIVREMRASRRRAKPHASGIRQKIVVSTTMSCYQADCSRSKVDHLEIENTLPEEDTTSIGSNFTEGPNVSKGFKSIGSPHGTVNEERNATISLHVGEGLRSKVSSQGTVNHEENKTVTSGHLTDIERRVIKNILILMAVFFGCCLTTVILAFAFILSGGKSEHLSAIKYGLFVLSIRTIINPGIYVFKNRNYRDIIKKLIPRCFRRRRLIKGSQQSITTNKTSKLKH